MTLYCLFIKFVSFITNDILNKPENYVLLAYNHIIRNFRLFYLISLPHQGNLLNLLGNLIQHHIRILLWWYIKYETEQNIIRLRYIVDHPFFPSVKMKKELLEIEGKVSLFYQSKYLPSFTIFCDFGHFSMLKR